MPKLIDIPGKGTAEFPDEMADADITAAIYKSFPDLAEKNPDYGMEAAITPEEEKALEGPGRVSSLVRTAGQGWAQGAASLPEAAYNIAQQTAKDLAAPSKKRDMRFAAHLRAESPQQESQILQRYNQRVDDENAVRKAFFGGVAEDIGTPLEAIRKFKKEQPAVFAPNPLYANRFGTKVAGAIGSSIPALITAVASGGASLPVYATTALQLYQGGFDSAIEQGSDESTAHKAGIANMPLSIFEKVGDVRLGKQLRKSLDDAFSEGTKVGWKEFADKSVKKLATGSAGEAVTEGAQQYGQDTIENQLGIAKRTEGEKLARAAESAKVGFAAGSAFTAPSIGLDAIANRGQRQQPPVAPPIEQDAPFEPLTAEEVAQAGDTVKVVQEGVQVGLGKTAATVANLAVTPPKVEPIVEPTIKADEIDSTLTVPPEIKAPDVVPVVEPVVPVPERVVPVVSEPVPVPEQKLPTPAVTAEAPVTVPDVKGEMKVETFEQRMAREEDVNDWIKSANQSKRPPTTADEAWNQFTAVDRSRGVDVPGEDYFKSAWQTFSAPPSPPIAEPRTSPPVAETAKVEVEPKKWIAVATSSHRQVKRLDQFPSATGGLPVGLYSKTRAWKVEDTPENRAIAKRLGLPIRAKETRRYNEMESRLSDELNPAATEGESKPDIIARLESKKKKRGDKSLSVIIPGFDPESARAIWNTAIDVAIGLVKAGRALNVALDAAMDYIRSKAEGFDEASVRTQMEADVTAATPTIEYPVGPGAKEQDSQGRFKGPITRDTVKNWDAESEKFINQFTTTEEALRVVQDETAPIGADFREFILTKLLQKTQTDLAASKNVMESKRLLDLQVRIADILRNSGSLFGKTGAARHYALKAIEWMMPILTWRNLVKTRQEQVIGKRFGEGITDKIKAWLKQSGDEAVKQVAEAMKKPGNVVDRVVKKAGTELDIDWSTLMQSSQENQKARQRELYSKIREHPTLKDLSTAESLELTNLLDAAWQKKRNEIFKREFGKKVDLPNVKDVDKTKLNKALPELVRQANLGLLDNESFLNALAVQYGVTKMDGETAKKVEALAKKAQKQPEGILRARTIAEAMDLIRRDGGVKGTEILRDYWYASVLSGLRTQVDNGLAIINGALQSTMMVIRNPKSFPYVVPAFFRGMGEGLADFPGVFLRGEKWRLHNINVENPNSALEALVGHPNPLKRALGLAKYVNRLMQALGHVNAISSREAAKAWILSRSTDTELNALLRVTDADREAARAQALAEGTTPDVMRKRVREILEDRIPSEIVLTSTELGKLADFQNEPYGIAGHIYDVLQFAGTGARGGKGIPFFKMLSGTMFARYALNYSNEILNYMPPFGFIRWMASSPAMQGRTLGLNVTPEERSLFAVKATVGSVLATTLAAMVLGDDDDEKFIDLTGSGRQLDPKVKNQLLAQGWKPYSIKVGNTYVSYRQFGIAGIMGTVGDMRDVQLYDPEKWKSTSVPDRLGNAAISGLFIVRDSSALMGLADMIGFAQSYRYNYDATVEKKLPKYFARLAGSLIPNIAKEMDAWQDPRYFQANKGWEFFIREIPIVRRTVGSGPMLNVLGEPVSVERKPWSRWIGSVKQDPVWEALADKAANGVFVPQVSKAAKVQQDGKRVKMTDDQFYKYQKESGKLYRQELESNLEAFKAMKPDEAKEWMDKTFESLREQAKESVQ